MDKIFVKIPSEKKYISTVRLSISSIANTIAMDIECIEDLKVSISEVMNLFVDESSFFEISMVLTDQMIATTVIVVEMRYPTIIKCFNFILNLYLIP